jgi:serine protease AprX
MAKFRVKAFFMHEHELAAAKDAEANSIIQGAEWTDGYVMGVVDQSKFKSLSDKGLVVSVVEEVASQPSQATNEVSLEPLFGGTLTFGTRSVRRRSAPVTAASGTRAPKQKVISCDTRKSQFYIIRFHGPLTKARQDELKKYKIELVERVTRNKYTAYLKPADVKKMAKLDSVDTIRLLADEEKT